jgi:hypothetical protein
MAMEPIKCLNLHLEKKLSAVLEHLNGPLDFKRAIFQRSFTMITHNCFPNKCLSL